MAVPLPTDSIDWPPTAWQADYDRIVAQRDALTGKASARQPEKRRGGVIDRFRNRNNSATDATDRDRVHVPMQRQIARTSAALLFSEPPTLQIPEAHVDLEVTDDGSEIVPADVALAKATEERMLDLVDAIRLPAKLHQGAYVSSGTGGVFLRPIWDKGLVSDRPFFTVVHADHGIPVFRHDVLVEVTFWTELERSISGEVWRWLECHTPGKIEHALYVGRADQLGQRHPINERAETKGLIGPEGANEQGVVDLKGLTGIDTLLPSYVPNALPHPTTLSGTIGGADTEGIEDQLDALDEADTGWRKDVRLGRRRIIVPDQFLDHRGRGQGATFDDARDVFSPMEIGALDNGGQALIESIDFPVRADEFQATIDSRMTRICAAAGYSAESVLWANTGEAATATEILSRDALSADTTSVKRRYWDPAIAQVVYKLLQIDAALFGSGVTPMRPVVIWPEAAEQDMRERATTLNLVNLAGAASTKELVRMLHPDWTQRQVEAEAQLIKDENSTAVDPFIDTV